MSDEKTETSMFGYDSVVITARETLIPHLAHVLLFLQDLRDSSVFLEVFGAWRQTEADNNLFIYFVRGNVLEGPDGKNSYGQSLNDSQNKV